jgi:type II secretory pathway pseudopilin PulG
MKSLASKGITLMEMIVVIVLIGLAVPTLMNILANTSWHSVQSEGIADGAFYAQQLMEEIKSKRYDQNTTSPWTNNLGVDAGEDSGNKATFNDVDDFMNAADPAITNPAPKYFRSVKVEHALINALDSWQACTFSGGCTAVSNCANCSECCYKMITVTVWRSDNILRNSTLVTVIAGR